VCAINLKPFFGLGIARLTNPLDHGAWQLASQFSAG
jgi:hypothetical protein